MFSRKREVREGNSEIRPISLLRRVVDALPLLLVFLIVVLLYVETAYGLVSEMVGEDNIVAALTDALFPDENEDDEAAGDYPYGELFNADIPLLDFYTPTVMYWEPAIEKWSEDYRLNPNLLAIIIQIESCGNPYVASEAAAQGLFQVTPPNFWEYKLGGNQLDPEVSAEVGMRVFRDCLRWSRDRNFDGINESNYNVGLAFACYNAGTQPILSCYEQDIASCRPSWDIQAQYYYRWGSGIWNDARQGRQNSETLEEWVLADSGVLCNRAREVQERFDPLEAWQRHYAAIES
jgi:hypothetical protein